jgi:hypothetical protein
MSADSENNMAFFNERLVVTVLRWTARTVGTAILVLLAAIAIGEGVPDPLHGSLPENLLTVGFLTMIVGQIVAWKWEGIGSLLILVGFALFAIVNHGVPLNIVFGPCLVTGLLYLVCWWRSGGRELYVRSNRRNEK